jgi:hypothetical protein
MDIMDGLPTAQQSASTKPKPTGSLPGGGGKGRPGADSPRIGEGHRLGLRRICLSLSSLWQSCSIKKNFGSRAQEYFSHVPTAQPAPTSVPLNSNDPSSRRDKNRCQSNKSNTYAMS